MKATRAEPFHFVMIKPSHYDDDGYPIQWLRSAIPSNTLACLFALAEDARHRHVLGPEIDIRLHTYDETNRRVRPERIMRMIRKEGGKALIGLVGVQSNQFPRAVDLARRVHCRRSSGVHRRLSRIGLHFDAAGDAARDDGSAGARNFFFCWRGRGEEARPGAAEMPGTESWRRSTTT